MTVNDKLVQLVAKWYCDTSERLLVAEDDDSFYAVRGGLAVRVSPHPFSLQRVSLRDNVGAAESTQANIKHLFNMDVSELNPLLDLGETCQTGKFTGLRFTDGHSRRVLTNRDYLKAVTAGSRSIVQYGSVDKGEIQRIYVTPFETDEVCAVIAPLREKGE